MLHGCVDRGAAGHPAEELEWRHRSPLLRVRSRLPDQHLRARSRFLDRVVGVAVESAIERRLAVPRREPAHIVGLVPDAVAVHAAVEMARRDGGELAEQLCVRLDHSLLVVARGPRGRRPRQVELHADAVLRGVVDQAVVARPVVGGVRRRRLRVRLGTRDARPEHEHAQPRDAHLLGLRERPVAVVVGALEKDGIVLERNLELVVPTAAAPRLAATGGGETHHQENRCQRRACKAAGSHRFSYLPTGAAFQPTAKDAAAGCRTNDRCVSVRSQPPACSPP